jgi:hypothetical protein
MPKPKLTATKRRSSPVQQSSGHRKGLKYQHEYQNDENVSEEADDFME